MSPAFIARWRFAIVFLAIALGYCGIMARLYVLQVVDSDALAAQARTARQRVDVLHARRGNITDARGNLLAATRPVIELGVDPESLRPEDLVKLPELARLLGKSVDELLPAFEIPSEADRAAGGPRVRWRKLAGGVEDPVYQQILSLKIKGVYGNREYERHYPAGEAAAHVLGFVNKENVAVMGVERLLDFYMRGQDGWRETEKDGRRKELAQFQRREVLPRDGYNAELTIDLVVQDVIEQEARRIVETFKPEGVVIIVSDPNTGAILGLTNWPTFDPNQFWKEPIENMRNRAATDIYEPGSVFKIVPVSASLNEHLVTPWTKFDCGASSVEYKGRTIRLPGEHEAMGTMSVFEIVAQSSNRGAARMGMLLGEERLYKYARLFGFGEETGFEGIGEVPGLLHKVEDWDGLTISRLPMGHAIGVTALQAHFAMSAIANGGVLMRPHLVSRVYDSAGETVLEFQPRAKHRVLAQKTASIMTEMLARVPTREGTAAQAAIEGYQVAGKTGTTQKIINGHYSRREHVGTFTGFFPATAPRLAVTVVIDNGRPPSGGLNYGGITAAPAFRHIAERLIQYLAIEKPPAPREGSLMAATLQSR